MAKNTVRQALRTNKVQASKAPAKAPAKQEPAETAALTEAERQQLAELRKRDRETAKATMAATFDHKVVKVIDGKKRKDETGNVTYAGVNGYGKRFVRVQFGDEFDFINPDYLEVVGDQDAKTRKSIDDANKASREETLLIACVVGRETDRGVRLDYSGWFKPMWFPKEMVTDTGGTYGPKELQIFEIPAWKVRKERGADSYAALVALQDELSKHVD